MLKTFLIERSISGTPEENFRHLGSDIEWKESFVTDKKIYDVYFAKDEGHIREQIEKEHLSIEKVSEIKDLLDPSTEDLGYTRMPSIDLPVDRQLN